MFKELNQYFSVISSLSKHTIRSYEYAINNFVEYFGIESLLDLDELNAGDIQEWLSYLVENSNSKSIETAKNSANARFRVISALFGWLVDVGYLDESPCDGVRIFKEQKTVKVYLTRQERDKIILSCTHLKSKLMIAIALYTGLRRNEIVNIKIEDIKNGKLLVHGKGKKERQLALNEYVQDLISKYLDTREDSCEYLFASSRSGFSDDLESGEHHPVTAEAFRQIVKAAAKRAGISKERVKKIAPHTLRRTFAIGLTRDLGASSFQVQKALGHSSVQTTERYIEAAGSEIADEVMLKQAPPTEV